MSNAARFEVYPQTRLAAHDDASRHPEPTGEYGWRFRAANGQISAAGGEGFTREENAERAVDQLLADVVALALPGTSVDVATLRIVRVDS